MREKQPAVYILTNKRHGTLYIGVTADLIQRIWQHREGLVDGFSKRYGLKQLVWFEQCDEMGAAIAREKQLKEWRRAWKIRLIEETNPSWQDLWLQIIGQEA
ncbi:MAG: GIY-YIG nuclease family protein [Neisseria sp.]|nr:GIY-YIG nuclease family protein [Neisseria sp.]